MRAGNFPSRISEADGRNSGSRCRRSLTFSFRIFKDFDLKRDWSIFQDKRWTIKDPKISAPHQLLEEWAVVAPDGSELPLHDLVDQGRQVGPLERLLKTGHLVEDAPQSPDVGLLVIDLNDQDDNDGSDDDDDDDDDCDGYDETLPSHISGLM